MAGELLGGCDIVLEMKAEGQLKAAIDEGLAGAAPEAPKEDPAVQKADVIARIKKLIASSPVFLFMKASF